MLIIAISSPSETINRSIIAFMAAVSAEKKGIKALCFDASPQKLLSSWLQKRKEWNRQEHLNAVPLVPNADALQPADHSAQSVANQLHEIFVSEIKKHSPELIIIDAPYQNRTAHQFSVIVADQIVSVLQPWDLIGSTVITTTGQNTNYSDEIVMARRQHYRIVAGSVPWTILSEDQKDTPIVHDQLATWCWQNGPNLLKYSALPAPVAAHANFGLSVLDEQSSLPPTLATLQTSGLSPATRWELKRLMARLGF